MVHVATSVGCVLYRGCERELVWGCDRDTKGQEHLRIRNEYVDLKFRFNNILTNFLLQYKVKGNICKCYFVA